MANNNGYEMAPLVPEWVKKRVPDNYADDVLKDLIMFYVINTPCDGLSSSGIKLTEYGWGEDIWKNDRLKIICLAQPAQNAILRLRLQVKQMK